MSHESILAVDGMSVKSVMVLSLLSMAVLQAQAASGSLPSAPDWISTASQLTLQGALIVAVAILWKALGVKDALIVSSIKSVTEALQQSAATQAELRNVIHESVETKRQLSEEIALLRGSLGGLPCTHQEHGGDKPFGHVR
jgi:hypothetical protein